MWKKITAGVVLVIILSLSVGAFVDVAEAENNATGELVLEVKNQRTGESYELSMTIPKSISVADKVGEMFGKSLATETVSTNLYPDDPIAIRAAVYAEWTTSDVASVDSIMTKQSGETSDGPKFYSSAEAFPELKASEDTGLDLDDSMTLTPDYYFDQYRGMGSDGSIEYYDLLAEDVDGGSMTADITLGYTGENDKTDTATTSVSVDIAVETNSYDSTISLNADITGVGYE